MSSDDRVLNVERPRQVTFPRATPGKTSSGKPRHCLCLGCPPCPSSSPAPPPTAAAVAPRWRRRSGADAEVVGRAPGRVNLIGEHTDYNGGLCLPVALPHATYAAVRARDDGGVRIASRQGTSRGRAASTPSAPGRSRAGRRTPWAWCGRCARTGAEVPGLDIAVDTSVPVGAGLSSSAALECAVGVAVAVAARPAARRRRPPRAWSRRASARSRRSPARPPAAWTRRSPARRGRARRCSSTSTTDETARCRSALDERRARPAGDRHPGLARAGRRAGTATAAPSATRPPRLSACPTLRHATLGTSRSSTDDRAASPGPPRRHRDRPGRVSVVAARGRGLGARWARCSPSRTSRCATTSRSPAPELDVAVDDGRRGGRARRPDDRRRLRRLRVALVPEERVDAVTRAIDTAFAAAGLRALRRTCGPRPSAAAASLRLSRPTLRSRRSRSGPRGTRRRTARGPAHPLGVRRCRSRSPRRRTPRGGRPRGSAIASSTWKSTRSCSLSSSEAQWILAVARPEQVDDVGDLVGLGEVRPSRGRPRRARPPRRRTRRRRGGVAEHRVGVHLQRPLADHGPVPLVVEVVVDLPRCPRTG